MPRPPRRGHFSRSRSLAKFDVHFGPDALVHAIRRALRRSREPVRVLEVGCGEGRVLLELRRRFPEIELHGINRTPWPAMRGPESLRRAAVHYGIFTRAQIKSVKLPLIHFYNAKKLHFRDRSLDVVYSQFAIPYVDRKDMLLEEIWRALKVGGVALLYIDSERHSTPYFLRASAPCWVIYHRGRLMPLQWLARRMSARGFDVRCTLRPNLTDPTKRSVHLILRKNTRRALRLGLTFDASSSFDLALLNPKLKHMRGKTFWGYRSVYYV